MPTATDRAVNLPLLDRWLKRLNWLLHPVTIFVTMQIVWLAMLLIWVIWFAGQGATTAELARKFGGEYFDDETVIAILVVGCVLLGVILVGIIALFVFWARQSKLARRQRSFLSSVTHELKSPLASLQLTFETMIARDVDAETQGKMLGMALQDISRLKRMVDQTLIAGRLDRGVEIYALEQEPVEFLPLVDTVVNAMTHMDEGRRRRIVVSSQQDLTLRTSREALTLILSNLMENAIKYSPPGSPIEVHASRESDRILISVEDRGMGLDKKDRRRIFKMFQRSNAVEKRAIPGTGLGLYIVRSAVRAMGGRVWAESEGPGRGSSFYVSLPQA